MPFACKYYCKKSYLVLGLNCIPQTGMLKTQSLVPHTTALLGNEGVVGSIGYHELMLELDGSIIPYDWDPRKKRKMRTWKHTGNVVMGRQRQRRCASQVTPRPQEARRGKEKSSP